MRIDELYLHMLQVFTLVTYMLLILHNVIRWDDSAVSCHNDTYLVCLSSSE